MDVSSEIREPRGRLSLTDPLTFFSAIAILIGFLLTVFNGLGYFEAVYHERGILPDCSEVVTTFPRACTTAEFEQQIEMIGLARFGISAGLTVLILPATALLRRLLRSRGAFSSWWLAIVGAGVWFFVTFLRDVNFWIRFVHYWRSHLFSRQVEFLFPGWLNLFLFFGLSCVLPAVVALVSSGSQKRPPKTVGMVENNRAQSH